MFYFVIEFTTMVKAKLMVQIVRLVLVQLVLVQFWVKFSFLELFFLNLIVNKSLSAITMDIRLINLIIKYLIILSKPESKTWA